MWGKRCVLGAVVAGLALPAAAGAVGTGTVDAIPLPGAANSVVLAPDGSVWATLFQNRTVARIAPDGTVTQSDDLLGAPAGVAVAEGKVWVAVTGQKKVVQFNPGSTDTSTSTATPAGSCGPVAIAGTGNGRVVVSLPNDGSGATCAPATPSELLPVNAAGAAAAPISGRGRAFDLVASSGFIWAPDSEGDALRRLSPDATLTVSATFGLPAGSGAAGVGAEPDGSIAVSLLGTSSVARVAPSAPSGSQASVFATGIPSPFGVASTATSLFVAGSGLNGGSPTIRRFPSDGSLALPIQPLAAAQPWDVAAGPDGTVLFTDLANERLIRFTSRPPRVATGGVAENHGSVARIDLSANPGGNTALTTVEFGPSPAYGSTAVATPTAPGLPVASGTADVGLRAELKDLKLGTTYHYRAVVVTPEGTAFGESRTFTTSSIDRSQKPAEARGKHPKIIISKSSNRGTHQVKKIRVTELAGGERITVTCAGRGCPAKKKDRVVKTTAKKAGSLTVAAKKITSAKLGRGAKVTVQVTKAGSIGVVTTVSVSKKNKLSVKARCVAVGAKKPGAC